MIPLIEENRGHAVNLLRLNIYVCERERERTKSAICNVDVMQSQAHKIHMYLLYVPIYVCIS